MPTNDATNDVSLETRSRLRLLLVVAEAEQAERLGEAIVSEGTCRVELDSAIGATAALQALRLEAYDALIATHLTERLDTIPLAEALRAAGDETPLVVLGDQPAIELEADCWAAGADAYCHAPQATPRHLFWLLNRAIDQRELARENRRFRQAEQSRLSHEHDETERLLSEQRALIHELEGLPTLSADRPMLLDRPPSAANSLPASIAKRYQELLRAYVVMGAGGLAEEMHRLAETLAGEGYAAPQLMELHLETLGKQVEGLGNRSARHVMTRADLLVLEVMVHLAEAYRRRYVESAGDPQPLAPWIQRNEPAFVA